MIFQPAELSAWQAAGCGEDTAEKMSVWLLLLKVVSLGIYCSLLPVEGYCTKWTFDLICYNSSAQCFYEESVWEKGT